MPTPLERAAPAVPTHQRRKAERPQALLDAALALFAEKGFAATRTEEVAHRAGVSKGTLYLYFDSKEELLKAVIQASLSSRIAAGAQRVHEHQGSWAQVLLDLLPEWWGEVLRSEASGVFKVIITEVRNFPDIAEFYMREVEQPGSALLSHIVSQGIAAGEFRPLPVDAVVHSLVLPMMMLCVHKHSLGACLPADGLTDPASFIATHMRLLLDGLRQTAPPVQAPSSAPASVPSSVPSSATPP